MSAAAGDESPRRLFRPARPEDLEALFAVEAASFPPEQGASRDTIRRRLIAYPGHILAAVEGDILVGHIMGPAIAPPYIEDPMFADESCHREDHPHQAVFSLAVLPEARGRGIGGRLLAAMADLARRQGRRTVTLTCLAEKVPYYARFGFEDRGVGRSVHGGVPWHNMVLPLGAEKEEHDEDRP